MRHLRPTRDEKPAASSDCPLAKIQWCYYCSTIINYCYVIYHFYCSTVINYCYVIYNHHLSNTTSLRHVFFKSGQECSRLW